MDNTDIKKGNKHSFVSEYFEINKSENDKRNYRAFLLSNSMKVLIVSDPQLKKCAASMSVAVGSMCDPPDLQGLAHLLEHMLFVETDSCEKVGYAKFISEHAGGCNAFTTRDQTNYHFDVAAAAFHESLQRFAQFFSRPPEFPKDGLEREIQVVESEYQNKFSNDAWRKAAVEACTAKPGHSFSYFSTGNKMTLKTTPETKGIDVLKRLKQFHSEHYSSNVMSLVVLGKDTLEILEEIVIACFSGVENRNLTIPRWEESPYGSDECQKHIDVVPLADVRDLYVCFPIPDVRPHYKTFPHGYLSHLLGHKGRGSLYSILASKMWVNNVYVNASTPARGFGYFTLGLQLTMEGQNHTEEVLDLVFSYLAMLKKYGPQKYFWEELRQTSFLQFKFQEPENPIDFVQRISYLLHVYPIPDVLIPGYWFDSFTESVITKFLDCLNPECCRIMMISKKSESDVMKVEKWYSVKYAENKIDPSIIRKWKNIGILGGLMLPKENDFIPTVIDIKIGKDKDTPAKLMFEEPLGKCWFYNDPELQIPKAFMRLELFSPLSMADPLSVNLNHILSAMLLDSISQEFYGAILAGLNYTVKGTICGVEITVDGFDEKMFSLMERIVMYILQGELESSIFQVKIDAYDSGLRNSERRQPYMQIPYYMSVLLREKRFPNEQLLDALKGIDLQAIEDYRTKFLSNLSLEALIYGNVFENEAEIRGRKLYSIFKQYAKANTLQEKNTVRLRELQIPTGQTWVWRIPLKKMQASCCCLFFQIGRRNLKDNVHLELLDQMIYQPFFHQIRNNEKLGYIVRSAIRKSSGTQGLLFTVQGNVDPQLTHDRIEEFLTQFKASLGKMSHEELALHKAAIELKRKDVPRKVFTRGNRLWNEEIYTRDYNFKRNSEEVNFLQNVDTSQILDFFQKYFDCASSHRRCVALYLTVASDAKDILNVPIPVQCAEMEIQGMLEWKSKIPLYQM